MADEEYAPVYLVTQVPHSHRKETKKRWHFDLASFTLGLSSISLIWIGVVTYLILTKTTTCF